MNNNYRFRGINQALPILFKGLLEDGDEVPSRIGRTMELPFTGITLEQPELRELTVPGRRHNLAAQIAETMWVIAGRNDVEWLQRYLPRAKDYSDDGQVWRAGYGPRLRNYGIGKIKVDQLEYVVDTLRLTPSSRQAVISIWDPRVDTKPGKDIACNNWLHFLSRDGHLDLHVAVRSNDAMWGWSGINVFEWSTLLEMVAGMTGLEIGKLHFSVSSFHLYEKHWEKARQIADNGQPPMQYQESPRFNATGLDDMDAFGYMTESWFMIEAEIRFRCERRGALDFEYLTNLIDDYPEPMLQSWLRVIAWWWSGDVDFLIPIDQTDLYWSAMMAVQPVAQVAAIVPKPSVLPAGWPHGRLIEKIVALHNEKDAAYGDSWCKRGEILGIMANIARKIDRLGGSDTADESSLDTAMDLFVYLSKYIDWLQNGGKPSAAGANKVMRQIAEDYVLTGEVANAGAEIDHMNKHLRGKFEDLEAIVIHSTFRQDVKVESIVRTMAGVAWDLVNLLAEK